MKTAATSKKRAFAVFAVTAVIWLVLDQVTKSALTGALSDAGTVYAVPGWLKFELVHNIGAAWGLFGGATIILVALSLVVCVAIVVYLAKMGDTSCIATIIGAGLVFAGGIGNMIDRLAYGYVIDFISLDFIQFPVFNIADIGVTCGIALFLIGLLYDWRED